MIIKIDEKRINFIRDFIRENNMKAREFKIVTGNHAGYEIIVRIDEDRFEIKHEDSYDPIKEKEVGRLCLIRKEDGKVISKFSDKIGFITQMDDDKNTYFFVSKYKKKKNSCYLYQLQYKNENDIPGLKQIDAVRVPSINYDRICFGDATFLTYVDDNNGHYQIITSFKLDRIMRSSRIYSRIFKNISEKNFSVIYVQELFEKADSDGVTNAYDRVTYGIDPDTLKIVTDIYSERQNRRISLYTDEQTEKAKETWNYRFKNFSWQECFHGNDLNGSYTLLNEVLMPLDQYIEEHPTKSKTVDEFCSLKESFVKEFGRIK